MTKIIKFFDKCAENLPESESGKIACRLSLRIAIGILYLGEECPVSGDGSSEFIIGMSDNVRNGYTQTDIHVLKKHPLGCILYPYHLVQTYQNVLLGEIRGLIDSEESNIELIDEFERQYREVEELNKKLLECVISFNRYDFIIRNKKVTLRRDIPEELQQKGIVLGKELSLQDIECFEDIQHKVSLEISKITKDVLEITKNWCIPDEED
jgi:hypothetical protein